MFRYLIFYFLCVMVSYSQDQVLVEYEAEGMKWELRESVGEHDGALFIYKTQGGVTTLVGGDSSPFPLSEFGVPDEIAKQLARRYVDYIVANTPGGVETVRKQVQNQEIANDLHAAFSELFPMTTEPFYGASKKEMSTIKVVLDGFTSTSKEGLPDYVRKNFRPLWPTLLVYLADKPSKDLSASLLHAVVNHPEEPNLQQAAAVFAGRNAESFVGLSQSFTPEEKEKIKQAIHEASRLGMVGGDVKTGAVQAIDSI